MESWLSVCALISSVVLSGRMVGGQLWVANLTTATAELSYSDPSSDLGLHVLSSSDSLYISTLDGRCLIAADQAHGKPIRLVSLGRSMFIHVKTGSGESKDLFVPDAYTGVLHNSDWAVLRDWVRIFNSSSSEQESQIRLEEALLSVLSYPEAELLQLAAAALGETGVTGLQYPSVLPFYLTAMRLGQLLQGSTATARMEADLTEDCLSECPPCPCQECLGLCGYSCNCWKWVCGDCCYHLGCYEHDICCREKFVRTACLFPFNFKCESGYTCN